MLSELSIISGLGFGVAYLLGVNLSVILAMQLFRCPNCGARFGWHTFSRYRWSQPWAFKDCWHCGADLDRDSN
jgi:predicted RNA-binding Zn-ribbon protein involved in translation (DUF1610 family)